MEPSWHRLCCAMLPGEAEMSIGTWTQERSGCKSHHRRKVCRSEPRRRSGSQDTGEHREGYQLGARRFDSCLRHTAPYARVSEWFKEEVRKAFIRKFKSCPVLQCLYYNQLVKTKKKIVSLYKRFSLSKPPPRWGLFGGYRMAI